MNSISKEIQILNIKSLSKKCLKVNIVYENDSVQNKKKAINKYYLIVNLVIYIFKIKKIYNRKSSYCLNTER
jgi:hypothetical protein